MYKFKSLPTFQLNSKIQSCSRWYFSLNSFITISQRRRNNNFSLLSFFHLRNSLIPSLNYLILAKSKWEGLSSFIWTIKHNWFKFSLFFHFYFTNIVNCYCAPWGSSFFAFSFWKEFYFYLFLFFAIFFSFLIFLLIFLLTTTILRQLIFLILINFCFLEIIRLLIFIWQSIESTHHIFIIWSFDILLGLFLYNRLLLINFNWLLFNFFTVINCIFNLWSWL